VQFRSAILCNFRSVMTRGVAEVWSSAPRAFLARVEALVNRYRPTLVVLEDIGEKRTRKRTIVRIAAVRRYAASRHIAVVSVSRNQVRSAFGDNSTKHDIAVAIAEVFPEHTAIAEEAKALDQ